MQVLLTAANDEGNNRQALKLRVSQHMDIRVFPPGLERTAHKVLLVLLNQINPNRVFKLKGKPGADALDNGRGAAFLAVFRMIKINMILGINVADRPTAGAGRNLICQKPLVNDQ